MTKEKSNSTYLLNKKKVTFLLPFMDWMPRSRSVQYYCLAQQANYATKFLLQGKLPWKLDSFGTS